LIYEERRFGEGLLKEMFYSKQDVGGGAGFSLTEEKNKYRAG